MQVRVEVRAMSVRVQRDSSNLPVAAFAELATEGTPKPPQYDLFDVLSEIFKDKIGTRIIHEPEIEQEDDETDAEFALRKRSRRQAIQILSCKPKDRDLRVDLEWSSPPPKTVVDLAQNSVEYKEGPDDASMEPATICIRVPKSGAHAYMTVVQRARVISVFEPFIERWFRENALTSNFRLDQSGYIPKDYWKSFLRDGVLLELELVRDRLPSDITDLPDNGGTDEQLYGTTRHVIKVERGVVQGAQRAIDSLVTWVKGDHDGDTGTFVREKESYDHLRVKVAKDGMERTLTVGPDPESRFAPAFPIEVRRGTDGRADPGSLYREMVKLLDEVLPS